MALAEMENSADRLHNVFFYGLYMDADVLRSKGVEPRDSRQAKAPGYRLRVGNMATLMRDEGAVAHGMLYSLTHAEIDNLYWGAGLDAYVAEALSVETSDGEVVAALCCNLLHPPTADEANPEYLAKLSRTMEMLGLPVPAGT